MTPEQIRQLVRMAEEIEALERSAIEEAEAPAPIPFPAARREHAAYAGSKIPEQADRLVYVTAQRRRPVRAWSWLAAAACMGVVAGVAWRASGPVTAPPRTEPRIIAKHVDPSPPIGPEVLPESRVAQHGESLPAVPQIAGVNHAAAAADGCDSEQQGIASVVFAIARDEETKCGDLQHVIQRFAPGPLGTLTRADLLRLGYEATGFSAPDRILVVSVSGPVEELPHTQAQAEALIACMDLSKTDPETAQLVGELGHDEAKYAAAARSCLSDSVLVEAATLMGR